MDSMTTVAITGLICLVIGLVCGAHLSGVQCERRRELPWDEYRERMRKALGVER